MRGSVRFSEEGLLPDISGAGEPDKALKGLDSIAALLNLAAAAGIAPEALKVTAVLHGLATRSVNASM
jgi:hypothetical protein